jgi:hypothetical protein
MESQGEILRLDGFLYEHDGLPQPLSFISEGRSLDRFSAERLVFSWMTDENIRG